MFYVDDYLVLIISFIKCRMVCLVELIVVSCYNIYSK